MICYTDFLLHFSLYSFDCIQGLQFTTLFIQVFFHSSFFVILRFKVIVFIKFRYYILPSYIGIASAQSSMPTCQYVRANVNASDNTNINSNMSMQCQCSANMRPFKRFPSSTVLKPAQVGLVIFTSKKIECLCRRSN